MQPSKRKCLGPTERQREKERAKRNTGTKNHRHSCFMEHSMRASLGVYLAKHSEHLFLGLCYLIIYKIFRIYTWSLPEEGRTPKRKKQKKDWTYISSVCAENRISWNMETQQAQQAAGMILSVVLRIFQTMREYENPIRNVFFFCYCCWHKKISLQAPLWRWLCF